MQVNCTYQKVSFPYSKEPLWNKIFRKKSGTNLEGQNIHQIFLEALDHEIVSSLFEV